MSEPVAEGVELFHVAHVDPGLIADPSPEAAIESAIVGDVERAGRQAGKRIVVTRRPQRQNAWLIVGDVADIEAGERAGCQSILVKTGYGETIASKPEVALVPKCLDLACAAKLILDQLNAKKQPN